MNQRRMLSPMAPSVTGLSHFAPAWICAILIITLINSVHGEEIQTNQAAAGLGDLPLESLMQLEVPVISSASKFSQKATEAPAFVTVISADEIQRQNYRTLADVLQTVPGYNVSNDRNYSYLGNQGISLGDFNSRVLLLVDGHRVNNNLTDGAFIDNAFILDLDLVDRVEVIQGPSAVLYGNNAFFGVINVVTRKGGQLNGFEVSGDYGSYDTYKGRVTYGKSFTNGIEMLLSSSIYQSMGPGRLFYNAFNTPSQNNGVARDWDKDTSVSAFGSLSYGDLTLEVAFNRRLKDNPTAQFNTAFNVSGLRTTDDRGYTNLKLVHDFEGIVDLTAQVYYDYADHSIGYPFTSGAGSLFYKETQTGQWLGTEVQLSKRLWEKHTFTMGVEYRDDFVQHDLLSDPSTGIIFTDIQKNRQSYGVYGESDLELVKQVHVNAGVRYDQYGNFAPGLNPRVALIYDPFKQTTLKAIYGTAFRVPNFLELSDPRFQNIHPENIHSYQLVYEQGIGQHLRSSLSGFYNQMNDLIIFENGQYNNINADSKGAELALEGIWTNRLTLRASYTLQKAERQSGSQALPDSPENLIKFDMTVPIIKDKIFASLQFQFVSQRSTYYTTLVGQTIPGQDVNAYNTVNFTLFSQNLIKNLDFSATIYNLLDEHYSDPATPFHLQSQIPQNGRTFGVKLTYRF